ncbi:hypothetical protein [Robertmurraya siralis]|uniref:hypothetical protein n=1 Tax=Robertmurraya siralis TaxID=77777 RepID=UPI0010F87ED1|nr:hypothetical protein [Robertmurraya siralis]
MLHLNLNTFKFEKIFIEVRYKESFKLPLTDIKFKILDKLTKKYPGYNIENPEQILLSNSEELKQLHIFLNRIIINWDNPNNIDDFIKSSQADLSFIFKCLEINSLNRFGFRTLGSFEGSSQNAISEFIFKEFVSPKLKSPVFGDIYLNPRVQFAGKKGTLHFNFALEYQQNQTIHGNLGSQSMTTEIRNLLMVDLDCYKENVKVSKLENLLSEIKEQNLKIPTYLKAIKES